MEIQENISKAEEIAKGYTTNSQGMIPIRIVKQEIKQSCLEMAKWKDEQFSKFLLWLDDNYVIRRFTDGEPMTYAELIDNFESNSYERNTTKTD